MPLFTGGLHQEELQNARSVEELPQKLRRRERASVAVELAKKLHGFVDGRNAARLVREVAQSSGPVFVQQDVFVGRTHEGCPQRPDDRGEIVRILDGGQDRGELLHLPARVELLAAGDPVFEPVVAECLLVRVQGERVVEEHGYVTQLDRSPFTEVSVEDAQRTSLPRVCDERRRGPGLRLANLRSVRLIERSGGWQHDDARSHARTLSER